MKREKDKSFDNVKKTYFSEIRTKKNIIFTIIIIILMTILAISIINNTQILNSIFNISIKQENEAQLFSYIVYDNQDEQNMKVLITVNSEDGIEYIEYPNGKILYGNGKNTIAIDFMTSKSNNNTFKVKKK